MISSFSNIYELAADRQLATPESCTQNDFYGHATVLKKFLGWQNDISLPFAIEHGAFAGDFVWDVDVNSPVPGIMCIPTRRIKVLQNRTNKYIESIGPLIQYASCLLTQGQINNEKKRLGRNLLAFPAHSTHHVISKYDVYEFIKKLEHLADKFDTVRVCLYWKDILLGIGSYYEQAGIECVTAGHIFDPLFLPRLKSLLTIADMTISNCNGSYIGFSVLMGKPHYLWQQSVELSAKTNEILRRDCTGISGQDELTKQLHGMFSVVNGTISPEQWKFADDYWGIGVNKSKANFVILIDNLFKNNLHHGSPNLKSVKDYFYSIYLPRIGNELLSDSYKHDANNKSIIKERSMQTRIRLKQSEVEWIGLRFLDPVGRTFKYKEEYYRAIYYDKCDYVTSLFSNGTINALIKSDLLVDMTFADIEMDGFGLVIKPITSHFQVPPSMWCWHMIKDAAIKYVKLNMLLLNQGLGLIDGHINNMIQVDNAKPIWVDLGSIVPLTGEFVGLHEFCRCFFFPLFLAAKSPGYRHMARMFLKEGGISDDEMALIAEFRLREFASRKDMLFYLHQFISKLQIDKQQTLWSSYVNEESLSNVKADLTIGDPGSVHIRSALITNVLNEVRPDRIIDLGCNAGYYTLLASKINIPVLGLDFDETSINKLYDVIREYYGNANIAIGVHNALHATSFKADLVLALALTHHLFFTNSCSFEAIAKILTGFSNNYLITEYMPLGLGTGKTGRPSPDPLPESYSLEIFLAELQKYFRTVEPIDYPVPSGVSPRTLIVCHNRF